MKIYWPLISITLIFCFLSCEKENTPPQAKFTIDPANGNNETIFTFDASTSSDLEESSEELTVQWDWEGDGHFDTQFASKKTADHIFADPGEYIVTMVVKDIRGLSDTARTNLTVSSANLPPGVPENPSPESGTSELGINIILNWDCMDPEGDMILFNVFFGTSNPPQKVLNNHGSSSYDPGELEYGTKYYWNITARDSKGNIVEGPIWEFSTIDLNFGTLTDSRDGIEYSTIEIGSQWWMAENLNYESSEGSYCYEDQSSNCLKYGRLYSWEAAMISCPEGWHLPSLDEFETLVDFLGGSDIAGGKLKDYIPGIWRGPNTGATNISGFGALPAGRRYDDGSFTGEKYYAQFYSSTEDGNDEAYNLMLGYDYSKTYIYNYKKEYAISVRCIKN